MFCSNKSQINFIDILMILAISIFVGNASLSLKATTFIIGVLIVIFIYFKRRSFIIIAILLNENFFHLIDSNKIDGITLLLICGVGISLVSMMKKKNYLFMPNMIFLVSITIIEAINSYYYAGQSVISGIQASRFLYLYLLYFYVVDWFESDNKIYKLQKFIINLGLITTILFYIQFLFYNKFVFLNLTFAEARYGNVRFFTGFTIIIISLFVNIGNLVTNNIKNRFINILIIMLQITSVFIIAQTRNYSIALFIALFIIFILQNNISKKNIYVCGILLLCYLLLIDNPIKDLIISVAKDSMNQSGTIGFRFKEIEFYIQQIKENPLLGVGYYNPNFYKYNEITGLVYKFYTSDVGIIGFISQTGLVGVIWLVGIIVKLIKMIFRIYKIDKSYIISEIGILSYFIGCIYSTCYFTYSSALIYVVLLISIVEIKYKKILKRKEKAIE